MIHLRRISGSTWGPSLHEMKKLYVSSVLPIFSYACPVWFVDGRGQKIRGQLTKTLVQSLDAEQARFLRFVAGGFEASASEVVHKVRILSSPGGARRSRLRRRLVALTLCTSGPPILAIMARPASICRKLLAARSDCRN